ncbi:uncharacterized protein LOC101236598 [Hydra vulgaris]|uniref:uncharacterized protein LOC101236598 n=1 Tax=Hydra vulgaris TaxID=6087 RepID=UPI001F5FA1AF|nr:MFS-type transporter clz9-like [Hydra vulgaris]
MRDRLVVGAAPSSIIRVTSSGWTDSSLFIELLKHFVAVTHASKINEQLIVINGVRLTILPPHCTHKMQPLDRTFFKSLKVSYNTAASSWMLSNQGRRTSFFDMVGIFATAYNFTANIDKAINGFRYTGLYSINEFY